MSWIWSMTGFMKTREEEWNRDSEIPEEEDAEPEECTEELIAEQAVFRQGDAPPKMDSQEYIEKYLREKDRKWLEAYLYYNEFRINEEVNSIIQKYAMEGHFMDLKSAYIMGILDALESYNPQKGASFRTYQQYFVKRAVHDYIRTSRKGFTVPNDSEYLILRKIMAMFSENDYKYSEELAERIAEEVQKTPKYVRKMMEVGLRNMRFTDFYWSYPDDDGEIGAEDVTVDHSTEPCAMYLRCMQSDILREAYNGLDYRERDIVSAHLGFCRECWSTKYAVCENGETEYRYFRREKFVDIAVRHGITADSAERIYKCTLKKMWKVVEEHKLYF